MEEEEIHPSDGWIGNGEDGNAIEPQMPSWIRQDARITLLKDGKYKQGYLALDLDNDWEFVSRDNDGNIKD